MLLKKKGTVAVFATVVFTITTIIIFIVYIVTLNIIQDEAEMSSDDLVSSELAVYKNINLRSLGESKNLDLLVFSDDSEQILKPYITFIEFLMKNFNVNEKLQPIYKVNFIKGQINVKEFIIYNVMENEIEEINYKNVLNCTTSDLNGFLENKSNPCTITKHKIDIEEVKTPKGNVVEHTTIYAKISFQIETLFRNSKTVNLEEETDILKE
ncbi:MAG: hypothetical protein E7213_01880 [Clostridium sp.]|nr:hypothetical protein [Clostridium sp.]